MPNYARFARCAQEVRLAVLVLLVAALVPGGLNFIMNRRLPNRCTQQKKLREHYMMHSPSGASLLLTTIYPSV